MRKSEIEDARMRTSADLAAVVEQLGYRGNQLQFSNGAFVTSITDFFDDNPGALGAVQEWILENGCTRSGEPLEDSDEGSEGGGDEGGGDSSDVMGWW